jgi:hypothetical protein
MLMTELPDSRHSLRGLDAEGHEAWLIRGIAGKLYRCPGCHETVEIGEEHVIVHFVRRAGGSDHHHWHTRCVSELLLPELRSVRRVRSSETSMDRLQARGRRKPKKRRN